MWTLATAGGDLAQDRHPPGQPVDIGHGERHLALVGGGQQVQHRVGRAAMAMSSVIAFSKALKLATARGSTLASSCS